MDRIAPTRCDNALNGSLIYLFNKIPPYQ